MADHAVPQRTLNPDIERWLEQRQRALRITTTTTSPSGQTLDWVPIESQTSHMIAEPPAADAKNVKANPVRTTRSIQFDIGEAGPAGHVPILRPDLTSITSVDRLDRVQPKRWGLRVTINRVNKQPTAPDPVGYSHAIGSPWVTVYGDGAWLNQWDPTVDIPSSPGDDHSISQPLLQNCQKPQLQSLEGGLVVDRYLNGDAASHLFTYYTTNGYWQDGDNLGGYNRLQSGWVQYNSSVFPGIRINGPGEHGQSPQLKIGVKYQLWQGNWWFGFTDNESGPWTWLGYYPGSLFHGAIANQVDRAGWGGEVYMALADPCGTADQTGSGQPAAGGWTFACYQVVL